MKKGFTLIELLVVIAIIGILTSIVLVMLSSARNSSKAATIKEEMNSLRGQAAIYYSDNGSYGAVTGANTCAGAGIFTDNKVSQIRTKITGTDGGTGETCQSDVAANAQKWAYQVTLPDGTGPWCVDSGGAARKPIGNPVNGACL